MQAVQDDDFRKKAINDFSRTNDQDARDFQKFCKAYECLSHIPIDTDVSSPLHMPVVPHRPGDQVSQHKSVTQDESTE